MVKRIMPDSVASHEAQKSELEQLVLVHHRRKDNGNNNGHSLAHRVYRFVVDKIKHEDFDPGERISERKIASMMGISHVPVREAMGMLEQHRWIRRVPGKGVFVMELDGEQLKYNYQIREIIETGAVRIIAQTITKDQLVELKKVTDLLANAGETDNAEVVKEADCQFHRLIIHFTGNGRLEDFFESVIMQAGPSYMTIFWRQAIHMLRSTGRTPDYIDPTCHTKIYEAIAAGDADLSESLLRRHIQHSYSMVSKMLQLCSEFDE